MAAIKPRVKVPATAKAGEVITVKTLINHDMESGQRKDKNGDPIPRKIINKFEVTFNGKSVFAVDIEPAIAANPFFEFEMKVPEAGRLSFTWTDDDGTVYSEAKDIAIG